MSSIKSYKTNKGKAWRVQYRSPDGKSRTKRGFRTKNEAQAWADKNAASIHDQDWIDPNAGKVTINEMSRPWQANLTHLKPKTQHDMLAVWRNHVEPKWGRRKMASIKPSEVQAWVSSLDRSASLVRQAHAVLAQILDLAVMDKAIRENPARGVKLPRKKAARKVYLTAEQLGQLVDECTRYKELVWLLGTVGLRWGEAAALRVRDVNVLRNRINVERNAVAVGSEVVIGTPKTHEVREVAVPASVMRMLIPVMEGKGPDDLLWPRRDGMPMRPPTHGKWYYNALDRCMAKYEDFPRVTPHGLRHVAAGLMVSAGANVKVIQRELGHSSAAMTLDVYADLFDEDLEAVSSAVDEKISDVVNLSSNRA
ncbi:MULTISPECIES: site-specific integrase [Corynebacterium]|nr:site-specific integrase [Corynebacterium kefirresidentii]MCT2189130.1 site-specific integrase [Corynebacterium kefirresidentii]MDK8586586.1 site-specific integrase [Corynebacterium kefirresidentii]